jgi:hypothetical protein
MNTLCILDAILAAAAGLLAIRYLRHLNSAEERCQNERNRMSRRERK